MGFTYGLAVLLVIFEGIIIQCEGGGAFSSNRDKEDPPFLPDELIELIVSKTDFKTIHKAIRSYTVPPNGIVMSRILQDRPNFIMPGLNEKICGNELGGITIGNYEGLTSFFKKFGDRVKKVAISFGNYDGLRRVITQDIIKRYGKIFEELLIIGCQQDRFWDEISKGENDFIFPKVKKFHIYGDIHRNNFKLNLIFPKLESFTLDGEVADENYLENVKGLKELALNSSTTENGKLDGIFANNENLSRICLTKPRKSETMHSIAEHLTKLQTLVVLSPGENFLLRANNSPVCKLPSVTHFHISFDEIAEAFEIGYPSFDVPHLKRLTLHGYHVHDRIVNFIERFEKLEILDLLVRDYDPMQCIERLKHIKEFTISFHESKFDSLKKMFTNFDKKSKLQTLKIIYFDVSLYQKYEKQMKKFNIHLENSMKPTWTLSHETYIETGKNYLVFRRDPCKCEPCNK